MAQSKADKPSVATYADYELISPPNKLRKAISVNGKPVSDEDPVARAEAALAGLSSEFPVWMESECERLDAGRREVRAKGFTKATRDALFHAAHDIRSGATTLGYPHVTSVADSLCRLIEHSPELARVPLTLVDQHVDAIRAVVRESRRADIGVIAATLTKRLREVTDDFLLHENRDRPEHLDILGVAPVPPQHS